MTQEQTSDALRVLDKYLSDYCTQVREVEERLYLYLDDVLHNSHFHNAYEILGAVKFLRLFSTYEHDVETFRDIIFKYEGLWEERNGIWQHVRGGLKHPGTTGPMYYRLQPFQVFVLAAMFLMKVWINTEAKAGSRPLLPTECIRDGYIYDLRRLCTEFTDYTPRKTAKTQLAGFIGFLFFMDFDENNEILCCANAADQSKILYQRIFALVHQMDPKEKRIRFTASQINWKPGQFRSASCTALSAGGKTKDGLFAGLCLADEYGSAAYVNGQSDMGKLVSVVESSMGPRREPMTFISTTAGIIQQGPFVDKLKGIKMLLEKELEPDAKHELSTDRQMCLILEPDDWEKADTEHLLTSKDVRRKVNPMLGIIVQHAFYEDEISKARQNPEKMNEVICKLLNVYQGARVTSWLSGDKIRPLQQDRRVTDCKYRDGWQTFVGLDFSSGDDLFAITYVSINYKQKDPIGRFFADMEAWIVEETLQKSPNRPLYEKWVEQGWLKVCPGEVFDPNIPINALMEKGKYGVNLYAFGYDPAQSKLPVNTIKAWLQTLGLQAPTIRQMVNAVPQTFMVFNGVIDEIEYYIQNGEPWLSFSNNPMWPWQFGNCRIEELHELRKILKSNPSSKVDNIHALVDAFYLFDLYEGRIQQ